MPDKFLTGRIHLLLFAAVAVTIASVWGALIWMADQQNQHASKNQHTMVSGAIDTLHRQLKAITKDYSHWQDAFENVTVQNDDWVYSNIGTGVTESDTIDIAVIVQPDGTVRYAWQKGMEEEPDPTILDRSIVNQMLGLLENVPTDTVEAQDGLFDLGDRIVILSAARISPDDLTDLDPKDLPVNILGYELSPERMARIGDSFLINDLSLDRYHRDGHEWMSLKTLEGTHLAHLHWTPVLPGDAIFFDALKPIGLGLSIFALIGFVIARRAGAAANALSEGAKLAARAARTDSLTNLPNRHSFSERMSSPDIENAASEGTLAVIYIDVNGFKVVNDTAGHSAGDGIIRQFTDRMSSVLPEGAFLARVGGDEFNILLTDPSPEDVAQAVSKDVLTAIEASFVFDRIHFQLTASVGYAVADGSGLSVAEVVRRADVAMYRAKETRSADGVLYDPSLESGADKRKEIETALRSGLLKNEFEVHYQPIVESGGDKVTCAEALLRWTSEQLGPVPPSTFIPIAEDTGLIVEIGKRTLRQICRDLATLPELNVNLNVSPVELREPSFVENFVSTVASAGIDPKQIEIELTEGIIVSNPELTRTKLAQLRKAGFRIALDDFGTGFSSIGYLRELCFDKIKVDRSFVSQVGMSDKANSLLRSLVMLGDALDLSVVAEGIESEEQAALIRLIGFEYMQGYYFGKPAPLDMLALRSNDPQPVEGTPRIGHLVN